MKIKRCLKLLFRQTLYALFTACRDIVGCPRCCCCCAVMLLLPGQWKICLRFCQCFFDIVVWPGTRYNSLQVKTNEKSFELT